MNKYVTFLIIAIKGINNYYKQKIKKYKKKVAKLIIK